MDARTIAYEIESKIKQKSNWDTALSSADLEKVKLVAGELKSALGENSYASAWLTYQTGDKNAARIMLNQLFETQYTSTMAMKDIGFSGSNRILKAQHYQMF